MISDEENGKKKSKKWIGVKILGITLAIVVIGGSVVYADVHKGNSDNTNKMETVVQKGITPKFFESTGTKYYGQNYNEYLYKMYTRVRNSIMQITYYKPMGQQGMAKTVPSQQLNFNIANWVKSYCTQEWYISSEQKVGNENVPSTPEGLSNTNFANLEPQALRYTNYDQNESNLYIVPVRQLIKGTKGNDLGMGDGEQVFIFSGIKAAENSGMFSGTDPSNTIIKGNNEVITTKDKEVSGETIQTTKYIKDQKDIIVPKSLYEIENNITYNDVTTANGEIGVQGNVRPNWIISEENLIKVQDKIINSIMATMETENNKQIFPLENKERFKSELTTVIRNNLNLARLDSIKYVKLEGAMGAINNSNYQYLIPVVNVAFGNVDDATTYKKYFRLNITGSLKGNYGYNQIYVNLAFNDDAPNS